MTMVKGLPFAIIGTVALVLGSRANVSRQAPVSSAHASISTEWPSYGGGPDGIRYSPLSEINRTNVDKLEVAWTFDSGEGPGGTQCQPIVVNETFYCLTPQHKVVALDAATGKRKWEFDSGIVGRGANRGLTYWTDGTERRIFSAATHFVYALNATTGEQIKNFGINGRIDLREDVGRDPAKQSIILTTPGVIYKDMLIVGGRVSESLPCTPGDIRAYDVRTGKLRWSFHTIPHPGEFGYKTWPKLAWKVSGSANNWAGMTVDHAREIVFVPTGSAASDFYGSDRVGDDLFANTMLALDANTGKRIWHFQGVKHDIWDRDFPAPPALVRVKRGNKWIDAVAQTTKSGHVYVFERKNGKPLFPVKYSKVPASDTPGEMAAKTQPLPTKPAPFARQILTEDMMTNRTPEAHKFAVEKFRTFAGGKPFTPFRVNQETIIFPGFDGGAEWGGPAYDPETNLLYVNANEMAWTSNLAKNDHVKTARQIYLQNCGNCHGDTLAGSPPQLPKLVNMGPKWDLNAIFKITRQGAGRMPSFPNLSDEEVRAVSQYVLNGESKPIQSDEPDAVTQDYRFTGYRKFLDQEGFPAITPPWGSLNAINMSTGEYAWKIPLGEYPELAAKGMKDTGSENYGGPVVTAGGLVFIGATNYDRKFRAFDKSTGKLLWETTLPYSSNATPAVYSVGGRQYVVVNAEGSKDRPNAPKGAKYIAFALPRH